MIMGSQGRDRGTRIAGWVGLSVGLAVVMAALYAWRVASAPGPLLGADVMFTAAPTGELEVSPTGRFLSGTDLRPSGRVLIGMLAVRNQTGRRLAVQLRGLPNPDDLDGILWVEITSPQGVLFSGDLGTFRDWTSPLIVRRGQGESLLFRAWMPAQTPSGYEGDEAAVSLEFLSKPVGG